MVTKLKVKGSRVKVQSLKLTSFYCFLFIAITIFSGCVSTGDFETMRGDVGQSRKEMSEIKKDIYDLKMKTSNVVKEDDFRALRENQADLQSRITDMSKDIQVLTGKFDESKYAMEKASKDSASEMTLLKAQMATLEDQIKDIKTKIKTLEGQPTEAKKKPEEAKKESPQQQVQQPSKPAEPRSKISLYEEAYGAFKDKKYKQSREKFETFLKEYPQDELDDNAQFWVAETYYGERDFEAAILAYEAVLKKYPKSEKAPGALLKQGLCFVEIGDKKTGKTILDKVVELYPESREAQIAKKKIEEIEKSAPKKKK